MAINRILFGVFFFLTANAFAGGPTLMDVELEHAFIPIGFDDNDNSQVVVAGRFSDTCHKLGPTKFTVDSLTNTIHITQSAYQYSGICLRMVVPFVQVVNLGVLRMANYTLADDVSKRSLGRLPIVLAKTPSADDYVYAPVSDADVILDGPEKKQKLILRGAFTDRCMSIREVRVGFFADTVVVQPIVNYIENERGCGYLKTRFEYSYDLAKKISGGTLLHVRVMNGQAVNKIIDLP